MTGEKLGSGMSGSVVVVKHKVTGTEYACKSVFFSRLNQEIESDLRTELDLLKQLDSPHIIKIYESWEDKKHLHILLDRLTGGELYTNLIERESYTEQHTHNLFKQMLKAIYHCHAHGIAHRDLKLENFLFESPKAEKVKLIDFGLSKRYCTGRTIRNMCSVVGTTYYIAPEVLKLRTTKGQGGKGYDKECDMWGLGVILFMMLSGRPPFDAKTGDDEDIFRAIIRGNFRMDDDEWAEISNECKDLVLKLLQKNPRKRITASQALSHPWIVGQNVAYSPKKLNTRSWVDNVHTFTKFAKLKQTAIEMIAFSLSLTELKELRDEFEKIDTSNKGVIDYQAFLVNTAGKLSPEAAKDIFDKLDVNNSGYLTFSEFLSAALGKKVFMDEDHIAEIFSKLDDEHSGFIDLKNLAHHFGHMYDAEQLQEMLTEADLSKTGHISLDEFKKAIRGHVGVVDEEPPLLDIPFTPREPGPPTKVK